MDNPQREHARGGVTHDARITDVFASCISLLPQASILALRSLDSMHESQDIHDALGRLRVPSEIQHGVVVIKRGDVRADFSTRILTGYDEVWLFDNDGFFDRIINAIPCTSDSIDFGEGIPDELRKVFQASRSFLLLGGGFGVNYLTRIASVADHIESLGS